MVKNGEQKVHRFLLPRMGKDPCRFLHGINPCGFPAKPTR
ncbi:hypothetical protein HMPREF3213_01537 [Heyndrickxia coagulans]|uniref:Uncharacterized protein n=1 Tax=Heyndrickxia coagulans TaxID=1398 RepID=A0A133KTG3_HEYCO|nr:hypothetical protein HMPREF3213_01537 [Heyndrickxia coagulans]